MFDKENKLSKIERFYNIVCSIRFFKLDDSKIVLVNFNKYQDLNEHYLVIDK